MGRMCKLGIPVLIHSGEPKAFFDPIDKFNERWLHARENQTVFALVINILLLKR